MTSSIAVKSLTESAALSQRREQWDVVRHSTFDVAIVGAGVNGASLYRELCEAGYRVLLLDEKDFAAGTSQASGLMIWGGIIYLRSLDVGTVRKFCAERDRMIREESSEFRACPFRFLPSKGAWQTFWIRAGLHFYWLLGGCRRSRPRVERRFPEKGFLNGGLAGHALRYEEGFVTSSDARLVNDWILAHRSECQVPLNYCRLDGAGYERARGLWRLDLRDTLGGGQREARARVVVNAAGAWTDSINRRFGRESPYRHIFSKGVFLGVRRDRRHELPLVVKTRADYLSLIPWGPISLWGPTETVIEDPAEGFQVEPADVECLKREFQSCFSARLDADDVVSLRCGVRPLAVPRDYRSNGASMQLTRRAMIHRDHRRPWISVYGGKLTGCMRTARSVRDLVEGMVSATTDPSNGVVDRPAEPEWVSFPGLTAKVPSASWCVQHEQCYTLEDYLRRRTNIAQWVPRGGLGHGDENLSCLTAMAEAFPRGSGEGQVAAYRERIERDFDTAMGGARS